MTETDKSQAIAQRNQAMTVTVKALSAGPITISDGVTVTLAGTARWVIL